MTVLRPASIQRGNLARVRKLATSFWSWARSYSICRRSLPPDHSGLQDRPRVILENGREAHLSTQHACAQAPAWFPEPYGKGRWPQGHRPAPRQGTQAPQRLSRHGAAGAIEAPARVSAGRFPGAEGRYARLGAPGAGAPREPANVAASPASEDCGQRAGAPSLRQPRASGLHREPKGRQGGRTKPGSSSTAGGG